MNKNKSEKKQRMTKQRRMIMDILSSTKSHPTAEWIISKRGRSCPISVWVRCTAICKFCGKPAAFWNCNTGNISAVSTATQTRITILFVPIVRE